MIVIVGGFAIVFFYSGTFFNWDGVKGLYLAFKAWTETGAAGHGHEKAWDYWLGLMMPHFEIKRADFFGYELPMLRGLNSVSHFARSLRISICVIWRSTVWAAWLPTA